MINDEESYEELRVALVEKKICNSKILKKMQWWCSTQKNYSYNILIMLHTTTTTTRVVALCWWFGIQFFFFFFL